MRDSVIPVNFFRNVKILRMLDVCLSLFGVAAFAPFALIALVAGWLDSRSPIFVQIRIGRNGRPFPLLKFRSMPVRTPTLPTHMISEVRLSRYGRFIRRTKIDEMPQLINVLRGEMSLVGPRPCLQTQIELIKARQKLGVDLVRPGVTGLSQILGVDMSDPERLARIDALMIQRMGLRTYFSMIIRTVLGRGQGDQLRSEHSQIN